MGFPSYSLHPRYPEGPQGRREVLQSGLSSSILEILAPKWRGLVLAGVLLAVPDPADEVPAALEQRGAELVDEASSWDVLWSTDRVDEVGEGAVRAWASDVDTSELLLSSAYRSRRRGACRKICELRAGARCLD